MRLRRSLAYARANNPDSIRNLIDGNVDCIVLDLEDGVPDNLKPEVREMTSEILKNWDFRGKERIVRINAVGTVHYDADMEKVVAEGLPDAVRLPKCERTEDILKVDRDLSAIELKTGIPENTIELILMIETPLGVMNTYSMCSCCERVTAVGIGMEDLTAAMGTERRYELGCQDMLYARQKMLLEGKAAGVQVLDATVLYAATPEWIYEESINDRYQGFDGRSCSARYPKLIDAINRAFSPSAEQLRWAHGVKETYEKAISERWTDIVYEGKAVDPPVIAKADRIIDIQSMIDVRNRNKAI